MYPSSQPIQDCSILCVRVCECDLHSIINKELCTKSHAVRESLKYVTFCMYMYIEICICTCVYICMHKYIRMHLHTSVRVYVCIYVCMSIYSLEPRRRLIIYDLYIGVAWSGFSQTHPNSCQSCSYWSCPIHASFHLRACQRLSHLAESTSLLSGCTFDAPGEIETSNHCNGSTNKQITFRSGGLEKLETTRIRQHTGFGSTRRRKKTAKHYVQ